MKKSILLAHSAGMLAAGGINRLAACPVGPRIMFEKPNDGGSDPAVISPEDIVALQKKLDAMTTQVKGFGDEFVAKIKSGEKVTADLKENVDKALAGQGELREQIGDLNARAKEIEQTVARRPSNGMPAAAKTPGELFVENDRVKAFLAEGTKGRGRVRVDLAAITTAAMPGLIDPQRLATPVLLPERRMTVRDLITPGRTASNAIQYWKQISFINAAAPVVETATKPESTLTGELVTSNVATIAHWMLAAKQVLEDSPMLQSLIDGQLRYGLAYAEEDQLLNGDGTGANLHGIIPQASDYAPEFAPATPQRIDTIRLALLQVELALFPATGIVMNPIGLARIELTKDNEGRYIYARPQDEQTPRLWGRPVVATPAMDETEFLTGAFKLGAQIFDREDANVELSTEDSDNFRKNLVTLRAEERLALAVYRGSAFVHGDFGDAS